MAGTGSRCRRPCPPSNGRGVFEFQFRVSVFWNQKPGGGLGVFTLFAWIGRTKLFSIERNSCVSSQSYTPPKLWRTVRVSRPNVRERAKRATTVHSCARGRRMTMRKTIKIDLDNFDANRAEAPFLTSPRSLEACRQQVVHMCLFAPFPASRAARGSSARFTPVPSAGGAARGVGAQAALALPSERQDAPTQSRTAAIPEV